MIRTILLLLAVFPALAQAAPLLQCGPNRTPIVFPQTPALPICPPGTVLTSNGVTLSCVVGGGEGGPSTGLPADPVACASGQYVIDQDASGVLRCAQVQWSQIASIPTSFAPSAHTHAGTDITSVVANATNAVNATVVPWGGVTSKPTAFPPSAHIHAVTDLSVSGTPSSTTYLRGDGVWSTPAGGGGGSGYPGVASDGANGLAVSGAVASGTGDPSRINVTSLTVAALQALGGNTVDDYMQINNGADSADCTVGGGSAVHWCRWTGSAWVAVAVGATGPAGSTGATGPAGPTGPTGPAPSPAYATVTYASPIAWNLASSAWASGTVTLTGDAALNISNPVAGAYYTLIIKQDATGSRVLTLGSGCTWKIGDGGSGAVVLSTAANAIDVLAVFYDGTNCFANLRKNFN